MLAVCGDGLDPGDDAVVAECRLDFDLPKTGVGQHFSQLPPRVLPAVRAPDEHQDAEADGREWSSLVVVEQHFMHDDAAARWQAFEALAGEESVPASRPVVVNVRVEMQ